MSEFKDMSDEDLAAELEKAETLAESANDVASQLWDEAREADGDANDARSTAETLNDRAHVIEQEQTARKVAGFGPISALIIERPDMCKWCEWLGSTWFFNNQMAVRVDKVPKDVIEESAKLQENLAGLFESADHEDVSLEQSNPGTSGERETMDIDGEPYQVRFLSFLDVVEELTARYAEPSTEGHRALLVFAGGEPFAVLMPMRR